MDTFQNNVESDIVKFNLDGEKKLIELIGIPIEIEQF